MSEEFNLVSDLALILISAGVVTIISKALKQPLILGYLVAGFLVGPHLGIFYTVSDIPTIKQWSDIGIIFLLFALGLDFSFKKMIKVGASALLTAGTTCIGMMFVGMVIGTALNWSSMECIFLGGLMAMSSTTIIIKAYDELGYKNKPYAPLVFGTLVVEDLIAVLLMVLLSTLAVSQKFEGGEMVWKIAELAFFIILWFLVGIYVIPTFLRKARKYLSDEILLIVSIGLCFLMVKLATLVGFSSALGAFVMGSILSETLYGERIEKLLVPIKNLFGAIFFVSVGMMIDPGVIAEHWLTIIILSVTAVVGIVLFSSTGAILSRQSLSTSIHTSFSLAQLGEFSFIIAGLGCSMGVMRDFIYPVIITVSVITTFTTPYMIKAADPALAFLERKLPRKWLDSLSKSSEQKSESSAESKEWKILFQRYAVRVVLYSVILIAILLGSNAYLIPLSEKYLGMIPDFWRKLICLGVELIVMLPFVYGLGVSSAGISVPAKNLLKKKPSAKYPILLLVLLRAFIAVDFIIMAVLTYFQLAAWSLLIFLILGLVVVIVSRRLMNRVSVLEQKFINNLNAKENAMRENSPVITSVKDNLSECDVRTHLMTVSPDSRFVGMHLRELPFRQRSGANIVKIGRENGSVLVPSGDEIIFPGDKLLAVGSREQIARFVELMEDPANIVRQPETEFGIINFTLGKDSYLTGKVLRTTSMRAAKCMVVSVIRDGENITNPSPDFRFKEGDVVWVAGDKKSCDWYK